MKTTRSFIFLAVLSSLTLCACQNVDPNLGYTSSNLYREGIRSVQVNIPSTKEFRRGLEFELAEALVKRIEADTPYKVLKGPEADSVLEWQLVRVPQRVLSNLYDEDLPAEKQQQMSVNFTWKDRRTGRILAQGENVRVVSEYVPPAGETFYTGQQELMDNMARRIVSYMRQSW